MVPEPGHVEDSSLEAAEVALQVDVKCAYCEFEVSDTEFDFECVNVGSSKSYRWVVMMRCVGWGG